MSRRRTGPILLDGEPVGADGYRAFHRRRIRRTLDLVEAAGGRRILEVGGHPWVMAAAVVERPALELVAAVSAEEHLRWPDDIVPARRALRLRTPTGREATFAGYTANVERRLFPVREQADTVLACEVVEHLLRAPHLLFLNANRWLPPGGTLVVTTPNGARFRNPFRRRPPFPALRCRIYERHAYLYTREGLVDLLELCGFEPVSVELWDPYPRSGASRIYTALAGLPVPYLRELFAATIAVRARKARPVDALPRVPKVYDPRGRWERVDGNAPEPEGARDG